MKGISLYYNGPFTKNLPIEISFNNTCLSSEWIGDGPPTAYELETCNGARMVFTIDLENYTYSLFIFVDNGFGFVTVPEKRDQAGPVEPARVKYIIQSGEWG